MPTFQWQFNGSNWSGATGASFTRANSQPVNAGLCAALATSGAGSLSSDPVVVGLSSTSKLLGPGTEIAHGVFVASNGNTFDRILPFGPARPLNYNQNVLHMKRHAGIVTGADGTSNASVFSMGPFPPFDPTGAFNSAPAESATVDAATTLGGT